MNKKKTVLLLIVALVVGIVIGAGGMYGINNQTGTNIYIPRPAQTENTTDTEERNGLAQKEHLDDCTIKVTIRSFKEIITDTNNNPTKERYIAAKAIFTLWNSKKNNSYGWGKITHDHYIVFWYRVYSDGTEKVIDKGYYELSQPNDETITIKDNYIPYDELPYFKEANSYTLTAHIAFKESDSWVLDTGEKVLETGERI